MDKNPFQFDMCGHQVESTDAQSRIDMVKKFGAPQCQAALEVAGLQKTVRAAIDRRMRQIGRPDHA